MQDYFERERKNRSVRGVSDKTYAYTHKKGTDFNKPYSFMAEKQIACNEIEREREIERVSARESKRAERKREKFMKMYL